MFIEETPADLCEMILDCWPDNAFAQSVQSQMNEGRWVSDKQKGALQNIWESIPEDIKLECGY